MTYQYNITHNRSIKDNARLWKDRLFLSLLLLNTLVIAFYNSTALSLFIAILSTIALVTAAKLIARRHKVPFVEIANGTLNYFDAGKGEMVSVSLNAITHISTRFCELNLHTNETTHSLNLGLIRNEKTRWEIKEVIREMARRSA